VRAPGDRVRERARVVANGDVCVVSLINGPTQVALLAQTKLADPHDFIAWGTPPITTPSFEPITGELEMLLTKKTHPAIDQNHRISTSSLAFDLAYGATAVVRMPVGSASYVMSKPPQLPQETVTAIEGDDVFVFTYYGTSLWSQVYVMRQDGTLELLRGPDKTHVRELKTDGKTLFWVEEHGLSDPSQYPFVPQPNMDVYAAPYTTDPMILAKTAKKIASVPNHRRANNAEAFGGVYAFDSDTKTITVVRGSDGAMQQISVGDGRAAGDVVYVSESEVWAILNPYDEDSGTVATGGVALARFALKDW
jgi:hypothetical protein